MKILGLLLALGIFAANVSATELKLATITTDTVDEYTVFFAELNTDGSIQGVHWLIKDRKTHAVQVDEHATLEMVRKDGAVIKKMEGRDVVTLYTDENFDAVKGGKLKMYYLSNGVTGSHDFQWIVLTKKNNNWVLSDEEGNKVNSMFVKGKWSRLLRRWIGVETIKTEYLEKK